MPSPAAGAPSTDDIDHLTVFDQFLSRPLVFFGGVFYPLSDLPGLVRTASSADPMGDIVSGVRYGLLGQSEVAPFTAFAVLAGASLVAVALVLVLPRRGDGLTECGVVVGGGDGGNERRRRRWGRRKRASSSAEALAETSVVVGISGSRSAVGIDDGSGESVASQTGRGRGRWRRYVST